VISPGGKPSIKEVDHLSAPVMAALTKDADGESWSAEALEKILVLPNSFGLMAWTEAQPLGFLLAQVAADEAEIIHFVVAPPARRRGVGRSLLTEAMARAFEKGARAMFLEVASDNEAAQALYKTAGFTQVGIRPDYYRVDRVNYTDALIFRCDLITAAGI
jgi:ribosomal-protein-alanine N-acetyltransferase